MNEKNERNLDSTVDEIMEEIREQTVSEVKDINEKEQKSEERPRKKKVTKTKRPSGHHVSGDGVDHKAASDKDRPVKKKAPRRKKKVVREETGLLDLEGAEEWRDEEETAVPPVIKSADILSSGDAEAFNPDEEEILGYRDVLNTIHENYEYIPIRANYILQLHRDLYSYSQGNIGGTYKNSDNVIAETDAEGHQKARFIPVPAFQTAEAIDELCARFLEAWEANLIDKLILIPMFILDFLCIHPFNDGNGRMSRLLTLLLFYKAGYIVGKYVSMEMLIEKTKETYYEALQASSIGCHEGENSYEPFVKYYLGIILKAYNEFESRVEHLKYHNLSKPDRIKAVIDNKVGKITKKEIMELCPDISKVTVERTLTDLVKSGYIAKVGAGPSTGYVRI